MAECKNTTFETIGADEVCYGLNHDKIGIKDSDNLKVAFRKLAEYVEKLSVNCNDTDKTDSVTEVKEVKQETMVDYTINPVIKTSKGVTKNKVEHNWKDVVLQDSDKIVKKSVELYSGKTLIAHSDKDSNVFEVQPKDYPLDMLMTAHVHTKNGLIKTEKLIKVSADDELEMKPSLEIKRDVEIEDKRIAILNSEIAKIRKELENLKSK